VQRDRFEVSARFAGVGISYLVVVGDLLPDVMKQLVSDGILCERSTWVVLTGVFVLLPLASLRHVLRCGAFIAF
jgi:amino acid permease